MELGKVYFDPSNPKLHYMLSAQGQILVKSPNGDIWKSSRINDFMENPEQFGCEMVETGDWIEI